MEQVRNKDPTYALTPTFPDVRKEEYLQKFKFISISSLCLLSSLVCFRIPEGMGTILLDLFAPEHSAKQHLIALLWWTECTKRPITLILELDMVFWTFYILRRYKVGFSGEDI